MIRHPSPPLELPPHAPHKHLQPQPGTVTLATRLQCGGAGDVHFQGHVHWGRAHPGPLQGCGDVDSQHLSPLQTGSNRGPETAPAAWHPGRPTRPRAGRPTAAQQTPSSPGRRPAPAGGRPAAPSAVAASGQASRAWSRESAASCSTLSFGGRLAPRPPARTHTHSLGTDVKLSGLVTDRSRDRFLPATPGFCAYGPLIQPCERNKGLWVRWVSHRPGIVNSRSKNS